MASETKEIYEFGPYTLDVGQHRFERSDGVTNSPLPEIAFQTLVFLVRNHGRLVTKNELLEAIWPDTAVEENNLNKSIHAIRHALGNAPRGQKYIETIPKHGYRFIADVRKVDSFGSPTVVEDGIAAKQPDSSDHKVLSRSRSKRPYLAVVALLLIGAAGLGGWYVKGGWKSAEAPIVSAGQDRSPAYDLYVRGKVKVASENREDTEAAIKVLEEAVAIDPNFAEAYAQLARGYNTMAFKYSSDSERKRYYENAEVAIDKALALNPDLAEAHFARGLILWTHTKRFPHEMAIRSYKRSLELDPNLDETHHQLSLVYSHVGLLDEAIRSVNKALEINPNNTLARFRRGVYIAYQGKFDEAIAIYKTIPDDFTPLLSDRSMAEALIHKGRLGEAEAIVDDYLSKVPQDEGGSFTSLKALLLAKAGRGNEAEQAIDRAVQIGTGYGHFHHTTYNIASAYAALNKPDDAVKWLEVTAEDGFPNYPYFEIDPNLDNIRKHPRFTQFMTKLKAQWERFKTLA
jgi:DNA-binding winged helix-turn-helix (wHTH) protein/Tfp pilus assembly protein PilF